MRYKFNMPIAVKHIAEWQLEQYPEDQKELAAVKHDMIHLRTQTFDGIRGRNRNTRPTEDNAIRILSAPYLMRLENGVAACDKVLSMLDPVDIEIIRLLFWEKSKTVDGAGQEVFLEKTAIYQRLNKILGCLAAELGYLKGK